MRTGRRWAAAPYSADPAALLILPIEKDGLGRADLGDARAVAEAAAGAARFTYAKADGAVGTMNYRHAPDDVYDDPDEMRRWARLALEAGLRGAAGKRLRQSKVT